MSRRKDVASAIVAPQPPSRWVLPPPVAGAVLVQAPSNISPRHATPCFLLPPAGFHSGHAPRAQRRGFPAVVLAAKKGGAKKGGGGGGQKKGAGSPADPPKKALPYLSAPVIMQNLLLIESYFRKTGR